MQTDNDSPRLACTVSSLVRHHRRCRPNHSADAAPADSEISCTHARTARCNFPSHHFCHHHYHLFFFVVLVVIFILFFFVLILLFSLPHLFLGERIILLTNVLSFLRATAVPAGTVEARITYGNSVRLSVRLPVCLSRPGGIPRPGEIESPGLHHMIA